jgi:hypothetical protein
MRWVRKSATGMIDETICRQFCSDGCAYMATMRRVTESPRMTSHDELTSDSVDRAESSESYRLPMLSRMMRLLRSSPSDFGRYPVTSRYASRKLR